MRFSDGNRCGLRRASSKSGKGQGVAQRTRSLAYRRHTGKPFRSYEQSRIARLCQECRVGSFAATTHIPEYGITPGVRSPLDLREFRIPQGILPFPGIPAKVHLAKHRVRKREHLLALSKQRLGNKSDSSSAQETRREREV